MAAPKTDEFSASAMALARFAKALSHPARIAILEALAKKNKCICGDIVDLLPLAQSTVSQHLKELKLAGLIHGEIDGLKTCYCLSPKAITQLEKLSGSLLSTLRKGLILNKCC